MGLSFLLLILSGTIGGSWVPMINLIAVFALPVYAVLSKQMAPAGEASGLSGEPPPFSEGAAIWANFGVCFLGVVLASMIGFPLILLHSVRALQTAPRQQHWRRVPHPPTHAHPHPQQGTLTLPSFGYWMGSTAIAFVGFSVYSCVEAGQAPPAAASPRSRF